jgi:hypothetical protein
MGHVHELLACTFACARSVIHRQASSRTQFCMILLQARLYIINSVLVPPSTESGYKLSVYTALQRADVSEELYNSYAGYAKNERSFVPHEKL